MATWIVIYFFSDTIPKLCMLCYNQISFNLARSCGGRELYVSRFYFDIESTNNLALVLQPLLCGWLHLHEACVWMKSIFAGLGVIDWIANFYRICFWCCHLSNSNCWNLWFKLSCGIILCNTLVALMKSFISFFFRFQQCRKVFFFFKFHKYIHLLSFCQ